MKNLLKNRFINKILTKVINITIPFKSKRKEYRKYLNELLIEAIKDDFRKQYPDYYQFVMFHPWGDFYIPCALMTEFKKQHNNTKILAVCTNETQEQVLKSFDAIDEIVKIPENYYHSLFPVKLSEKFNQCLEKGKLYCLSHWLYSDADCNKSINFLELYTKMLGLKSPTALNVKEHKHINNTNKILIYPESNSFDDQEFPLEFWITLADELSKLGFEIVFNTKEKKYGDYQTTFLPVLEQLDAALGCKFVIGMRSGFSDILAINNLKNHIVVYPKNMYFKTISKEQQKKEFNRAFIMEKDKTFEENMFRITSLKMFNPYAIELHKQDKQLLNTIVNIIINSQEV